MFAKGSKDDSLSLSDETYKLNREIFTIFAKQTGRTRNEIELAVEKAGGILWMSASEAKAFGIVDEIIN